MIRRKNQLFKLTVLMSVYNAERYLAEAIDSILNQTFKDFEFIIIDDGSTDKSREIIDSYRDPRIKFISRANKGLTYSLNQGLKMSQGEYVARQDADDISLPTRLEREFEVMENNPDFGMVGSNFIVIDEEGHRLRTTRLFTHPDDLAVAEIVSNQFGHGSVMMRKSTLDKVGLYDPKVGHVEDYDLFIRISRVAKIANLKEPLYLWRRNPYGIILSSDQRIRFKQIFAVRDRGFRQFLRNRKLHKVLSSFHPFSVPPSPLHYLDQKAVLFRNLAYLYRQEGKRMESLQSLIIAVALAPWRLRNYRYLWRVLVDRSNRSVWKYRSY